jgi:metal-responsive CopG/Arc/MetJ family transcriptional regulator
MTRDETEITLKMPTGLVEKLDAIAKLKYQNRADVIIDACAYFCQFHDMNSEQRPETMRNILFDLARHDGEFRKTLRDVLREGPANGSGPQE